MENVEKKCQKKKNRTNTANAVQVNEENEMKTKIKEDEKRNEQK